MIKYTLIDLNILQIKYFNNYRTTTYKKQTKLNNFKDI